MAEGWTAAAMAREICHPDQMTIWTGEVAGALSMGEYLRSDLTYDEGLAVHETIGDEIKSIVRAAISISEMRTLHAELVEALETMTAQADALTDCLNEFTREEDGASVCGEYGDHLNRTIHKARALLSRIKPGQGRET